MTINRRQADSQSIAVTGAGMVSSLGLDIETSCAAARAGISRADALKTATEYSESDWADIGIQGHAVQVVADGFESNARILRLGVAALSDLLQRIDMHESDLSSSSVLVNLSSQFHLRAARDLAPEEFDDEIGENRIAELTEGLETSVLDRVLRMNKISLPRSKISVRLGDQSGFADLIVEAASILNSGTAKYCIVGGIDSYADPTVLQACLSLGLVKTEEDEAGWMPGEGSAFLLLERGDSASKRGASVLARISSSSSQTRCSARFGEADAPPGVGIAQAVMATLADGDSDGSDCALLVCGINGDPHWANEWGHALVRIAAHSQTVAECPQWFSSSSFGELGAASGPVCAAMIVRAFERGYAPDGRAVAWQASDDGRVSAFTMTRGDPSGNAATE